MLTHVLRIAAVACCITALTGCPGSGSAGGGGITVDVGNQPPAFTSAASVAVLEGTSGVFYTATAQDADGNPLTFSLTGGVDAPLFSLTPAGGLSFLVAPVFNAPTDSNHDNVYNVQIAVSDGVATRTLLLAVTVTDRLSAGFRVRRVVAGMASPVLLAAVPDNSGRVFVGELAGRIRLLTPSNGTIDPVDFLDLRGQVSTNGERGLLGMATSPDFATTGLFYVFVTDPVGTIEVRRYRTMTNDHDRADTTTMQVVLRQAHPNFNHNGGWIGFGPDGLLYIAIGDGGGSGDPDNNGQNRDTLLGKILRIDVARDQFPTDDTRNYGIPPTNPFASGGGAPEVWAYGLRNPFRNGFDPATGNLFIGDVGENTVEELNLMRPTDGGANFGWSILEGTRPFKGNNQAGLVAPVAQYLHGAGGAREGSTVIGGVVYRGPVDSLRGQYLFADFIRPNVWSLPVDSMVPGTTLSSDAFTLRDADFAPDAGAFTNIVAFGTDQSGNVYLVDLDGEIFIIEAAPPAPAPLRATRATRAVAPTTTPMRHFCAEAWDGRTVRWSGTTMIVGGEGFACVRKYYEALARMPPPSD